MKTTIIKFLLLIPLIFSLSGCFDVKREISYFANGGGEEKLAITIDKEFFTTLQSFASQEGNSRIRSMLDTVMTDDLLQPRLYKEVQKAINTSIKEVIIKVNPDGSKEIDINYSFDDPACIVRIVSAATGWFATNPELVYSSAKFSIDSGEVRFRQSIISAFRAFNYDLENSSFKNMMLSKNVTQDIKFPFDITTTNAMSQQGNTCSWTYSLYDALYGKVEALANMTLPEGLDLPYAEKIVHIEKVDTKSNPLVRIMIYNPNKEWVKTISGVTIKDDKGVTILVTSLKMLNIIEGQGYWSVKMNNDELAGIDEMRENDTDPKMDLCFLRFSNFERIKSLNFASSYVTTGQKVKIFYHPSASAPVTYIIDGVLTGTTQMSGNTIYEIKPDKLLPNDAGGGAIFNMDGQFLGMLTDSYIGDVSKIYAIPASYIKTKIPATTENK